MPLPSEVVVGVSLPKTGRYGQSAGIIYDRAYRLWVDQVNQKGGLLGRPVRFLAYDDGSSPERTAENYRRLIYEDQTHLLLGPCHSALVEAAAPLVEGARRLLLQGSGSSHEIFRKGRKYLFLCWSGCDFDYPKSYLELMARMRAQISAGSIGLICTDGRIGQAVALGVRHYAPPYGMRIVSDEVISHPPCDYEGLLRRVKSHNPDLLVVGLDHTRPDEPMHSSVLAAQKAGFRTCQIWLSDNPEKEDLELGTAADGVFMRATWVPVTPHPLSKKFLSSFISAYGEEPEYHAAGGFACCQVLEQVVEGAGTLDNEVLREALLKRSFQTVMGEICFRESGLPDSTIMLCQWQNRKLEIVYPNWAKTAEATFESPRH